MFLPLLPLCSPFPFSCAFYLTYIYCSVCVCSRHSVSLFFFAVFLFLLFSILFPFLARTLRPPHTLFVLQYVVSRRFTFVSHTHFLDRRTLKIDYFPSRLCFPLYPSTFRFLLLACHLTHFSCCRVCATASHFFSYIMHAHAHAHLFGFLSGCCC